MVELQILVQLNSYGIFLKLLVAYMQLYAWCSKTVALIVLNCIDGQISECPILFLGWQGCNGMQKLQSCDTFEILTKRS